MAPTHSIRVGKQGRLVLPHQLRDAVRISEGDALVAWVEDDGIVLASEDAIRRRLRGRFKSKTGRSAVDALLAGRRADALNG
ncbi:MAG: AbrB/MazE/SpoVT family DNA-binding domain-containing protein [Candidatus Dormibacteraceae bacterium]